MNTRMLAAAALAVTLTGCASLMQAGENLTPQSFEPTAVRVVANHVSSLSQHFGAGATDDGYQTVALEVHWQRGPMFLDLSDGVNFGRAYEIQNRAEVSHDSLIGPREVFQARLGIDLWHK